MNRALASWMVSVVALVIAGLALATRRPLEDIARRLRRENEQLAAERIALREKLDACMRGSRDRGTPPAAARGPAAESPPASAAEAEPVPAATGVPSGGPAYVSPGEPAAGMASNVPPSAEEIAKAREAQWVSFDVAMDKEMERLEKRKEAAVGEEKEIVDKLVELMLSLDQVWMRSDGSDDPAVKEKAALEARQIMGQIIGLSARHREQELRKLAASAGYREEAEVRAFLDEVDRIYRDTQMDWPSLFNRGN